jgi:hypothetical protein
MFLMMEKLLKSDESEKTLFLTLEFQQSDAIKSELPLHFFSHLSYPFHSISSLFV